MDSIELEFVEGPLDELGEYGSIPMRYSTRSRIDVPALVASAGSVLLEIPCDDIFKDYDALSENLPSTYSSQFDTSQWRVLRALHGRQLVGGCIVAMRSLDFDMLENRQDLGVIVDFRVLPDYHRRGIGRALWNHTENVAKGLGLSELNVETQDTNVAACRFYRSMGCMLKSARSGEYGPRCDEAKIVWRKESGCW